MVTKTKKDIPAMYKHRNFKLGSAKLPKGNQKYFVAILLRYQKDVLRSIQFLLFIPKIILASNSIQTFITDSPDP